MTNKKAILAPLSILLLTAQAMLGVEADRKPTAETITLVSSEGQKYTIPAKATYLSEGLKAMLCLASAENKDKKSLFTDIISDRLELREMNNELLEKVALLINTVHGAIEAQKNSELPLDAMIQTPKGHIIAKNLQPVVNKLLSGADVELLIDLLRATDFLQMPECLNAIASVFVAKIRSGNQLDTVDSFRSLLEKYQLTNSQAIYDYTLKHWELQNAGITNELSVADLAATNDESIAFFIAFSSSHITVPVTLLLIAKKLTSLDGLRDIPGIEHATLICLDHNLLFHIPAGEFESLKNLSHLYIHSNYISHVDADTFVGLNALTDLNLHDNPISQLPSDIFEHLSKLTTLKLGENNLTTLDENLFAKNTSLVHLDLSKTQLTPETLQAIRTLLAQVAPNCQIIMN